MSKVRDLKRGVWGLLERAPDLSSLYRGLEAFPPRKAVSPLIGAFCHREERVRWWAILGLGYVTARIAEEDLEAARIVIRRLMWMLNEESGGMAWGAPEALAECLYQHRGLAAEYTPILVSYLRPDGNLLEFPPAQRGVAWGIGRLAEKERERLLAEEAPRYLLPVLDSSDLAAAGLAAWALKRLGVVPEEKLPRLRELAFSDYTVHFFDGRELRNYRVGDLAREILEAADGREPLSGDQGTP
ncbi:HEAT repeat domain-containing protein [Thermosulfurimonas marina]|uniref:HEAT repeat domain-containing protein n=1 Tax=Thermosulfurimonas marina TaxID=2047767 RepID=A0A6H1WUH4_9BACT|nr:DVU0298 family protein [Thermosulfurimonas marina]QJA06804.1 HEAT repeat domain-containing protein [Thermosulfurimonas marina]